MGGYKLSNTKVKNYIEKHWNETIKFNPHDNDTLLGLPFPYCVPSVGNFDECTIGIPTLQIKALP